MGMFDTEDEDQQQPSSADFVRQYLLKKRALGPSEAGPPVDAASPAVQDRIVDQAPLADKYEAVAADNRDVEAAKKDASDNAFTASLFQGLSTALAGPGKTNAGFYEGLRQRAESGADDAQRAKAAKLQDLLTKSNLVRQGKQDERADQELGMKKTEFDQNQTERAEFTTPGTKTAQAASATALTRIDQAIAEGTRVGVDVTSLKQVRDRVSKGEYSAKTIKEMGGLGDFKDLLNNQEAMARIAFQEKNANARAGAQQAAEDRRNKNATNNLINNIRDDVNRDPEAKAALATDRHLATMESLAAQNSGQADEAFLMAWEKTLDPNSVVMPSEFVRSVQGAASLPQQVQIWLGRVRNGKRLPPEIKGQFVNAMKTIRQNYTPRMKSVMAPYEAQIQRNGLDRREVFAPDMDTVAGGAPKAPAAAEAPKGFQPRSLSRVNPETGKTETVEATNEQELQEMQAEGFK
jgi:hypothetical protein